jgi:hypothetical protein
MAGCEGKSHCEIKELQMKKYILLTAFINLIFLNACSGDAVVSNSENVNAQNANANTVVVQEINTNMIPMKGLRNANIDANQINPVMQANGNKNVKIMSNEAPAPYDSTVSTTMSKDGKFLETRTFRKDPLIQKVERIQEEKKVKVYLKNGKVVEVPYDKGSTLFPGGAPQDILTAAGVKSATVPQLVNPSKVEEATKDAIKKIQ